MLAVRQLENTRPKLFEPPRNGEFILTGEPITLGAGMAELCCARKVAAINGLVCEIRVALSDFGVSAELPLLDGFSLQIVIFNCPSFGPLLWPLYFGTLLWHFTLALYFGTLLWHFTLALLLLAIALAISVSLCGCPLPVDVAAGMRCLWPYVFWALRFFGLMLLLTLHCFRVFCVDCVGLVASALDFAD